MSDLLLLRFLSFHLRTCLLVLSSSNVSLPLLSLSSSTFRIPSTWTYPLFGAKVFFGTIRCFSGFHASCCQSYRSKNSADDGYTSPFAMLTTTPAHQKKEPTRDITAQEMHPATGKESAPTTGTHHTQGPNHKIKTRPDAKHSLRSGLPFAEEALLSAGPGFLSLSPSPGLSPPPLWMVPTLFVFLAESTCIHFFLKKKKTDDHGDKGSREVIRFQQ